MQSTRSSRRRGFTLIELLVVVAIIGLLVSILLPSLKTARDQAKSVVDLSHMKATADVANLYADDNLDLFLAGIIQSTPPNFTGSLPYNAGERGLAYQYWLPYLGYQVPLDKADTASEVNLRQWKNLFAQGAGTFYRGSEKWQGRMADAFATIDVYQCPGMPEISSNETGEVTRAELDYLTNAMPIPFGNANVRSATDLQLAPANEDSFAGVPSGSVHYIDKRPKSVIKSPSDYIYITEVDESLVKRDFAGGEGVTASGRKGRLSFIFNAFFIGGHISNAIEPRMDNDQDEGGTRKRHPGGMNALFFDGHGETFAYKKIDPGPSAPFAIRLRYFSDPSKLAQQWQ